jgi:hypothetical protein
MSDDNVYVHDNNNHKKPKSVYQQLSGILNALKTEEISVNEAISKIQLKDNTKQIVQRPYCKVNNGLMELHGITNKPITMNATQWKKFLTLAKSNYIDNYMKYNEERLNGKSLPTKLVSKNKNKNKNANNNNNSVDNNTQNDDFEVVEADTKA